MELCTREKAVFFLPVDMLPAHGVQVASFLGRTTHYRVLILPVNILTVSSPAFLAARHTTVCLDRGLDTHGVVAGFLGRTTHYRVS